MELIITAVLVGGVTGCLVFVLVEYLGKGKELRRHLGRRPQKALSFTKKLASYLSSENYLRGLDSKLKAVEGLGFFFFTIKTGSDFILLRVIFTGLAIGLAAVYESLSQHWSFVIVLAGLVTWFLPDQVLKKKLRLRQERVLDELPGTVEILAMAMEAGLTFDLALRYIIEHYSGLVRDLFARAKLEIDAGMNKKEAFKRLVESSGSEDMKLLIGTILRAEEQGGPIKDVLLSMAEAMRFKQKCEIEARANRLPTTMLIPIFIFIVPPILLIYTLPALLNLKYMF